MDFTKIDDANRAVEQAKGRYPCSRGKPLPAGKKQIVQVPCQTADIIVLWNRIGAWLNAGAARTALEADAMAAALEHWLRATVRSGVRSAKKAACRF